MATPVPLTPPRLAEPINGYELSYVKRSSAEKQAHYWNMALADDPAFGPTSGLVVGVAALRDSEKRYPLIWVHPD